MSLLAKPADYTNTTLNASSLNTEKNTIYDDYGTVVNGQGSINYQNLSLTANIRPTQVIDGAMLLANTYLPGTQTATRPTKFSGGVWGIETGLNGIVCDTSAGNQQAQALVGAAQTFALTAGKGVYLLTSGAAASLSFITGGVQDQVIFLVLKDANTTVNHTATNTANSFHLSRKAAVVGDVGFVILRLMFDARLQLGQWYEIGA